MHCDKCGKENREGSKFCRSCGVSLGEESHSSGEHKKSITEFKINWKNPILLSIVGAIVIIGLLYGGYNAYAYVRVSMKISTAEKLQKNKDYVGSLSILNALDASSGTENQKKEITKVKDDDKKFSDYKTLFDASVLKVNASSTVAELKEAQKNLQTIDSAYPDYENVKTKLTEIGGLLMTALENDSAASKALAEKNKKAAATAQAAAAAAQAAKDRAEQNTQSAISSANAQADQARGEEVLKSFTNQLLVIRNDFSKNGVNAYINYLKAYNAGDYSLSTVYGGGVISVCNSTQTNSKNLRNTFTGLPVIYENASINLEWAGYYLCKSIMSWVNHNVNTAEQESDMMFDYYGKVDKFLNI